MCVCVCVCACTHAQEVVYEESTAQSLESGQQKHLPQFEESAFATPPQSLSTPSSDKQDFGFQLLCVRFTLNITVVVTTNVTST